MKKQNRKNIQKDLITFKFCVFYIYIRIILRNQNKPEIFKLSSKLCILAFFLFIFSPPIPPIVLLEKAEKIRKLKKKRKKLEIKNKQNPRTNKLFLDINDFIVYKS